MPRACSSVSRTVPSGDDDVARLVDQRQQRADIARPASRAPSAPTRAAAASGLARIRRITSSILATAMARPTSSAPARAPCRARSATRRRMTSSRKRMKHCQRVLQPHLPRPAVVQRQHVHAEAGLQLGEAVELVQHHLGRRVALQLDDDAHAGAVALVAQIADALDLLGAHQFGDAFRAGSTCSPGRGSR